MHYINNQMILSSNIPGRLRPSTNNSGNNYSYACGKARPLKHYRRGSYDPSAIICSAVFPIDDRPGGYVTRQGGNIKTAIVYPPSSYTSQINGFCDPERNAKNRVRGTSTLMKKNYYNSSEDYLHARCLTNEQHEYYYANEEDQTSGRCNSIIYSYDANGNAVGGIQICNNVINNKNNKKFGTQGAVSSSTRQMKLVQDTTQR
jgi:hypothetical protein